MDLANTTTETVTLLRTKLHMPRLSDDLIERPRLYERLNRGLNRKLTLVSASAGFGKTTLVVAWLRTLQSENAEIQNRVAWLSLDESDNDLLGFLNYFVAAIQTIYPNACPQTQGLWQAPQLPPLEHIATTLINEIDEIPETFAPPLSGPSLILVLDDFHVIQDDTTLDFVIRFLEHLPRQIHLVIISRQDPHLPMAQLRVQWQMTEIRMAELRFSLAEVQAYLNQIQDEPLSVETVTLLSERTEGWAAGIRLAVLSMQDHHDPSALVKGFKGGHRHVMTYLMDEVLSRQPAHLQSFLLRTSLLDRLCGPLCDAVCFDEAKAPGNSSGTAMTKNDDPMRNSQAYLEWLEQAGLFVVPLDDEGVWYRYHHLFQEFLFKRLHTQMNDEQMAALHDRASHWLGNNGYVGRAIHHALAAADAIGAARFIERHRHDLLNRDDWRTLERWLDLLPGKILRQRPALMLARVWTLHQQWRQSEIPPILEAVEDVRVVAKGPHPLDRSSRDGVPL